MTLPGSFFLINSFREGLGIIVRSHQHRHLEDDRAMIIAGIINKMHCHGALNNLAPVVRCQDRFVDMMTVHPRSAEPGEGPRVDIHRSCRIEPSYKL